MGLAVYCLYPLINFHFTTAVFMFPLIKPLLYLFDPETAHKIAIKALELGLIGREGGGEDPILASQLWGIDFPNPIGLAAGFDKEAQVVDAMLAVGFGFVEAGTVTPLAQPGNPRPRLFRLDEDGAAINQFGFNSGGVKPFAERLKQRQNKKMNGIVGANVGQNKLTTDGAADYTIGIETLCGLSDYLVVNISSPNTAGLRDLQARDILQDLVERVLEARKRSTPDTATPPPLLVKVAPDLNDDERRDIVEVIVEAEIDGLIVGNTTIKRPDTLKNAHRSKPGGLSGLPLMGPSTAILADFYRLTQGKIPLIGCGGVASGEDAYAKIRAGASLVQLYTALVFHGPTIVTRIKRELASCLRKDGFENIRDAIGADHR